MSQDYLNRINQLLYTHNSHYDDPKKKMNNAQQGIKALSELDKRIKGLSQREYRRVIYAAQKLAEKLLLRDDQFILNEDEIEMLFLIHPDPQVLSTLIRKGLDIKAPPMDVMRCNKALALGGLVSPHAIGGAFAGSVLMDSERLFALIDNYLACNQDDLKSGNSNMTAGQLTLEDLILTLLERQAKNDPNATASYVATQALLETLDLGTHHDDPIQKLDNRAKLFSHLVCSTGSEAFFRAIFEQDANRFHKIIKTSKLRSRLAALISRGFVNVSKIHAEKIFDAGAIRDLFLDMMELGGLSNAQYRRFSQSYKAAGGKSLIRDIERDQPEQFKQMVRELESLKDGLKTSESYEQFQDTYRRCISKMALSMADLNFIRYKNFTNDDEDLNDRYHAMFLSMISSGSKTKALGEINGEMSARVWRSAAERGALKGTVYAKTRLTPALHQELKGMDFETYQTIVKKMGDIPCFRSVNWEDRRIRKALICEDLGL